MGRADEKMRAVDKKPDLTARPPAPPRIGWRERLAAASWRDLMIMLLPAVVLLVAVIWAGVKSVRFAPPGHIRFISGPDGSSYRTQAERYKKIIEGYGVKVEILASRGALDNLQRLADPKSKIDVGFVQGGLSDGIDTGHLVSLGSVFAQPLMVYGQSAEPLEFLSQLKGKRPRGQRHACAGAEAAEGERDRWSADRAPRHQR